MPQASLFPTVFMEGRHAVCLSTEVAELFGKLHKNVLRDIENITKDLPEEFNRLNFEPVTYRDLKGEERPAYHLTKDGFAFLAMGFTGRAAARWKVLYIAEFNRMEAALALADQREAALAGQVLAAKRLAGEARVELAHRAMKLLSGGLSQKLAAGAMGVSRYAIYRLRRRFGFLYPAN